MLEIDLPPQFADLLKNHRIGDDSSGEFINTDSPHPVTGKAENTYRELSNNLSSTPDVMATTNKREQTVESCGDYGVTKSAVLKS